MELKPLGRYGEPRYPTHHILEEHPELLRLIPRRWQGNRLALAALGMAAGIVLGSQRASAQEVAATNEPASMVAPLFVHGQGRGALGCVAVSPPVFLSEAEGRAVIEEELRTVGLSFEMDTTTVEALVPFGIEGDGLVLMLSHEGRETLVSGWIGSDGDGDADGRPARLVADLRDRLVERLSCGESRFAPETRAPLDRALDEVGSRVADKWSRRPPGRGPYVWQIHRFPGGEWGARTESLPLDATDASHGVSFEYVSTLDYSAQPGAARRRNDPFRRYNTAELATALRSTLAASPQSGTVGVLYDPMARVSRPEPAGGDTSDRYEAALERSRDDLRAQVRGFIEWLKAEGVI